MTHMTHNIDKIDNLLSDTESILNKLLLLGLYIPNENEYTPMDDKRYGDTIEDIFEYIGKVRALLIELKK